MHRRNMMAGVLGVVAVATVVTVYAQERGQQPAAQARDVTMTGRVVDLHCFMTGQYPSSDRTTCTRTCILNGVPAGLETATGIVVLGKGMDGPIDAVAEFAYEQVEIEGRLFENGGVKYLDVRTIEGRSAHDAAPDDHDGDDESEE